jgi:hypothetical protein
MTWVIISQVPVVEVVEQINNYFRERLDELLAAA